MSVAEVEQAPMAAPAVMPVRAVRAGLPAAAVPPRIGPGAFGGAGGEGGAGGNAGAVGAGGTGGGAATRDRPAPAPTVVAEATAASAAAADRSAPMASTVPGGTGGTGVQAGANGTPLVQNATIPVELFVQNGVYPYPLVNISVNGGPNHLVLLDSGSTGS